MMVCFDEGGGSAGVFKLIREFVCDYLNVNGWGNGDNE